MSRTLLAAATALTLAAPSVAGATTPWEISASRSVAFVDVTVVPMAFDGILEHQTVVTRGGVIALVGATDEVQVPDDALVIDGAGRFLMPGLADLHTHLGIELTEGVEDGANEAVVWLANGVTTILNMGDQQVPFGDGLMSLRDDILAGRLAGPTIYTASIAYGPSTGANPEHTVVTRRDGRDHVVASVEAGYDIIKVYGDTPERAFDGISYQASIADVAIVGHIPRQVGLADALAGGLVMVTHANEFWCGAFECGANTQLVPGVADLMTQWDAWVSSTLFLNEQLEQVYCGDLQAFERFMSRPETRYVHPLVAEHWRNLVLTSWNPPGCHPSDIEGPWEFTLWYVDLFYRSGVRFVLGTDSPPVLGVPGFSLHEELRIFADMLPPFEVLTLATRNAGDFISENLPGAARFGVVEEGARADLLLLEANPLLSVENAKRRVGVMAAGRWFSESNLRTRLEEVAISYLGASEPRRVNRRLQLP